MNNNNYFGVLMQWMVLASLINIKDGSNAMRLVKGVWEKNPKP